MSRMRIALVGLRWRTAVGFAVAFAAATDLDTLDAELRRVLDATLEPAQASLWLRGIR